MDVDSTFLSWTETPTVWTPERYPEPLFPILTELMVPPADTTAVPPAATNGW